jgi:serine/threonine protein kinase
MSARLPVFATSFGAYRATGVIGEGGSGRVYSVDGDDEQAYAVKLLEGEDQSREKVRRFKNEILFGSRHRHKNIVAILDHGLFDVGGEQQPFYVMPRYPATLRHDIKRGIPPERVLERFNSILDGVEAAHLLRVVHRDLKPENILLNEASVPLIADFGIARFSEEHMATIIETKPTTRLANFAYAAPEQRQSGQVVDARTDIFALGLILNEMYTGEVPYGTGYTTIQTRAPAYGFLDDLVSSMISRRPDDRPATISEIKNALIARHQAFVAHQKLDLLRQTVVPSSEVDDPVAREAIRVVGGDWDGSQLKFRLSQSPPPRWTQIVSGRNGGGPHFMNYPPERIRFNGDTACWPSSEHTAQQQIEQFKGRVAFANMEYVRQLEEVVRQEVEAARQRLQEKITAEETRQRVAKKLQF